MRITGRETANQDLVPDTALHLFVVSKTPSIYDCFSDMFLMTFTVSRSAGAELRCFVFLSFFFFILKPDRLSSQLQGCIAAGTPSFSWLPELLWLSPGFGFFMAHGNPASSVYAAQNEDLLVELWPGSPRRQARGLGGQGDAGEDPGWDG